MVSYKCALDIQVPYRARRDRRQHTNRRAQRTRRSAASSGFVPKHWPRLRAF